MGEARTPIRAALSGEAWSMTSAVFGIDCIHDTDGRPLGERRATSEAKRGVPMELTSCPYDDERSGGTMNASALKQITGQFGAVTKDVAAFHRTLATPGERWEPMFNAVMDQLAAPARYLLQTRQGHGPVPVRAAAGHKLAAGYFGALQQLLAAEAGGARIPVTAEAFLAFVHDRRILIGASEVCAGQPHNLTRLTKTFVGGRGAAGDAVSADRVVIAKRLCGQVRLGVAWNLFDQALERELLLELAPPRLQSRTEYLASRLAQRIDALAAEPAPPDPNNAMQSQQGDGRVVASLRDALHDSGRGAAGEPIVEVIAGLLACGDSAITLPDQAVRARYARRIADALSIYRHFVSAHWHLEQDLRTALGYDLDVPMELSTLMFPSPRALPLIAILTGHRMECAATRDPELVLRNHNRVVRIPFAPAEA